MEVVESPARAARIARQANVYVLREPRSAAVIVSTRNPVRTIAEHVATRVLPVPCVPRVNASWVVLQGKPFAAVDAFNPVAATCTAARAALFARETRIVKEVCVRVRQDKLCATARAPTSSRATKTAAVAAIFVMAGKNAWEANANAWTASRLAVRFAWTLSRMTNIAANVAIRAPGARSVSRALVCVQAACRIARVRVRIPSSILRTVADATMPAALESLVFSAYASKMRER